MPTGLTAEQVKHFEDEGYLMVPDVFTEAELQPLRDEITAVIDEAARGLLAAGKISQTWEDLSSVVNASSKSRTRGCEMRHLAMARHVRVPWERGAPF